MGDLTRVVEVLAEHYPTGGATGCEGGWLRDCACGVQVETLWDRDGDAWERPFAAHQADMLAAAGLVVTEAEWGIRYPGTPTVLPMDTEAKAREWAPKTLWRGQPCEVVCRPRQRVTPWRAADEGSE